MKFLAELLPVTIFFIAYKVSGDDFYIATLALFISALFNTLCGRLLSGKWETRLVIFLLATAIFSAVTFIFRSPLFIQLKSTVLPWLFCLALFASEYFGKRQNFLKRTFSSMIDISPKGWTSLNFFWMGMLFLLGAVNLLVALWFSENVWVNYKFYGLFVYNPIILIGSMIIINRHWQENDSSTANANELSQHGD